MSKNISSLTIVIYFLLQFSIKHNQVVSVRTDMSTLNILISIFESAMCDINGSRL